MLVRHKHVGGIAFVCALLSSLPGVRGAEDEPLEVGTFATTHIVVKFQPGVVDPLPVPAKLRSWRVGPGRDRSSKSVGMPPKGAGAALSRAWERWGVKRMRGLYHRPFRRPDHAVRHGLDRTFILEVDPGTDVHALVDELSAIPGEVEYAEVDSVGTVADVFPNDPDFFLQYALHNTGQTGGTEDADIDAPEAWAIHTGDVGTVTIAIVDTGVTPVADLVDHMVPGINVADPMNPTTDTEDECGFNGHGTHVAGVAAAVANNEEGVAGVTWGANIMPVRVFGGASPCGGLDSSAAAGIEWAVDHGADIINVSLQWCGDTQVMADAVNYAYDNGVLVVSAAGNQSFWEDYCVGEMQITYPAHYENSMAVTATDEGDVLASFSNFGDETDVCAPGDAVYSTYRTGLYGTARGTSVAAPLVSGLAALVKSFVPDITHDELRAVIREGSDDLGGIGWDPRYGQGRINAYRTLLIAGGIPWITGSSPPDGAIDARQPSEPDGSAAGGWQWAEITFAGDTSDLRLADFEATEDGNVVPDLYAVGMVPLGDSTFRVVLNRKISPGSWTSIMHTPSNTSVSLGFLPGDVGSDGETTTDDLALLIDVLMGFEPPRSDHSTDIDRSGKMTPADVLRVIDLLNGGDAYDVYLGVSLP
ncbi:MAG: S8 family serine peptidase [Phycisphaerae bacterium]